MIVHPRLPRALWLVGGITGTFPGSDGLVRTLMVEVSGGGDTPAFLPCLFIFLRYQTNGGLLTDDQHD